MGQKEMAMTGRNRIMIYGPKNDGTYIVEFRTSGGASRHSEALPPDGFGDRLCLVAVKSDGMPVDAEDAGRVRVKRAVGSEIVDRGAPLEMRIAADERLRPEPVTRVDLLNLGVAKTFAARLGGL